MISHNTNAHGFRLQRKCFFHTGCCLVFVLLMSQASCRPSESDDNEDSLNLSDYVDADDIKWQNFPSDVEATTKDHPTIFYKEDIVSEDYDPNKGNKMSTEEHLRDKKKSYHRRKYKEIARHGGGRNETEGVQYAEPKKVYFDILPNDSDRLRNDDDDDIKFNEDDIQVEFISLLDPSRNDMNEKFETLNHHRHRRDVALSTEDITKVGLRHKRNPFYHKNSHYANQLPHYRGVFVHPQMVIYPVQSGKQPVQSPNYYNAISPGGGSINKYLPPTSKPIPQEPESVTTRFDGPVWDDGANNKPSTRPANIMTTKPPRRTPPPILQFGDEDYVTPVPNTISSNQASGSAFQGSAQPVGRPSAFPLTTFRPSTTRQTTTPQAPPSSRGISSCIWAISSCCTRSEQIRYQCFERLGCTGAFWDLNPCADDIFRLAVQAADQYLD